MKRKISLLVLILILVVSSIGSTYAITPLEEEITTISEDYIPSETKENMSEDQLIQMVDKYENMKSAAHEMAEAARRLGYSEDHSVIALAQFEWRSAENLQNYYKQALIEFRNTEEYKWKEKTEEFPVATQIWRALKEHGYNDYVSAGIMGNIMAECGDSNTLELKPYSSGNGYYGICQWSNTYYPGVSGANVDTQIQFLFKTIEYEFDTYGFVKQTGFDYDDFCDLEDARDAALAFAKCYERCSSVSYTKRQNNAEYAYNYFIN